MHNLLSFFFCFGVLLVYLPTTNKLMKVLDTDLFLIFSLSIYDSKKKKGGKTGGGSPEKRPQRSL